jgi:hypothetical protein
MPVHRSSAPQFAAACRDRNPGGKHIHDHRDGPA